MKLFTHNLLLCPKKTCGVNSYPLAIEATLVTKVSTPPNRDFLVSLLASDRLVWDALVRGAANLGLAVPPQPPADYATNDAFLQALHDVLFDARPAAR